MKWLVENWGSLVLILTLVISVLNSLTKHYSGADSKAGKALLFVIEILSFLRSYDVPGLLKLPLTSSPKPEVK